MILGILSDTHEDRMNALPYIIKEFRKQGVELIIHCGDIDEAHLSAELFSKLPVICALTDEQVQDEKGRNGYSPFANLPEHWIFTRPNERIIDIGNKIKVYVGHKRSFEVLKGSEAKLMETLYEIRKEHDGVRWFFSGHTHHQIYMQGGLIGFVNPGAVELPLGIAGGAEYAIIDTDKDSITFNRVQMETPTKKPLKLGVISDSFDVSEMHPSFWKKLSDIFCKEGVTHIIHCGDIAVSDIGIPALDSFNVYYSLRSDQCAEEERSNWHLINPDDPIVKIDGYQFYVELGLGSDLAEQSEIDMHRLCLKIQKQYPEDRFILCGLSHSAFYEEDQNLIIMNPGDVLQERRYVIVGLPNYEITFGKILNDPLPPLIE